jgi:NTE family protein
MKTSKKIGLALGSGGIRGFALLGVLQALKENDIPINFISGASSGSLVAAHYAIFQDPELLKSELAGSTKNKKLLSVLDLGFRGGLIKGKKFTNLVNSLFGKKTFLDTKIPLRIMVTDLVDGGAHVFTEGNIAFSVQASCTVPILFEPIKIKGHCFVDGGLSDPVPVDVLKKIGANVVIAVNLYHKNEFINRRFTVVKVALRSSRIALYNLAQASIKSADIVIAPDMSPFTGDNKFKKYLTAEMIEKMIAVGYKATIKCLPEIRKALK